MALRTKHVPNNHFFPTAYIAVSGGSFCPCEEAASVLKWPRAVCRERRFKIFDLDVGAIGRSTSNSEVPMMQAVYSSLKGLVRIHNPSLLITLEVTDPNVRNALKMAAGSSVNGTTTLVVLPRSAVPKVLWMADLRPTALPNWNKMRISVNIIFVAATASAIPIRIWFSPPLARTRRYPSTAASDVDPYRFLRRPTQWE